MCIHRVYFRPSACRLRFGTRATGPTGPRGQHLHATPTFVYLQRRNEAYLSSKFGRERLEDTLRLRPRRSPRGSHGRPTRRIGDTTEDRRAGLLWALRVCLLFLPLSGGRGAPSRPASQRPPLPLLADLFFPCVCVSVCVTLTLFKAA